MMAGDVLAHELKLRRLRHVHAAARPDLIRRDVEVQPGALDDISGRMSRLAALARPDMVLIGVSTGGPNALARLLPEVPGNIGVPC
jgi:chemotaxis response regulator CheB